MMEVHNVLVGRHKFKVKYKETAAGAIPCVVFCVHMPY